MRKDSNQSEYGLPGAEFTLPPEQRETLTDRRRVQGPEESRRRTELPADELGAPSLSAPEETGAGAGQQEAADRRSKRRRSLLLQFSAVAASVVLVTNSFGLDLLGLDGLFNDSVILGHVEPSYEDYEPTHPEEKEPTKEDRENQSKYYRQGLPVGGDKTLPVLGPSEPEELVPHNHFIAEVEYGYRQGMGEEANLKEFVYADPENEGMFVSNVILNYSYSPGDAGDKPGLHYDRATNTLTMSNYSGEGLLIQGMGNDFTVRLEGINRLEHYLLIGSGSLTLTGDGALLVNEKREYDVGIRIAGGYSEAALMIDENVCYRIRGKGVAIAAAATSAEKMLWLKSYSTWPGVMQAQWYREDSLPATVESGHYYTWYLVGDDWGFIDGLESVNDSWKEAFEAYNPDEPDSPSGTSEAEDQPTGPVEAAGLPIGKDRAFPILPNPLPNSNVPGYGVINEDYIVAIDSSGQRSIVYLNALKVDSYNEIEEIPGLSYDRNTNILSMDNYHGGALEVNMMGNSFRIELTGENILDNYIQIYGFYTGGSVTFGGSGSLLVNAGKSGVGLLLTGECSESCIMVEQTVTLDIYGDYAVYAEQVRTNKLIYYESDYELPAVWQYMSRDDDTSENPKVSGTFQTWVLLDQNGEIATRVWFSPDGQEPERIIP